MVVLLALGVNLAFAVFAIKRRSSSILSQSLLQSLMGGATQSGVLL